MSLDKRLIRSAASSLETLRRQLSILEHLHEGGDVARCYSLAGDLLAPARNVERSCQDLFEYYRDRHENEGGAR